MLTLFVSSLIFYCSWHVIQVSPCFEWVSWPKSDVGDFDSLSTLLRNKEFWSFSSSHQTLVAFMIAGTYQRESLHRSVCNTSMFQSIHRANQWNSRLWRGKSMKWRALHHSTYVIAVHHTLCLSFLTWFPFLSHSVHVFFSLFSYPVSLCELYRKALFILHIQPRSAELVQSCFISVWSKTGLIMSNQYIVQWQAIFFCLNLFIQNYIKSAIHT